MDGSQSRLGLYVPDSFYLEGLNRHNEVPILLFSRGLQEPLCYK